MEGVLYARKRYKTAIGVLTGYISDRSGLVAEFLVSIYVASEFFCGLEIGELRHGRL